ncbi:MAG: glycosyltransferase family 4 protein [Chloroflexota bacterium]
MDNKNWKIMSRCDLKGKKIAVLVFPYATDNIYSVPPKLNYVIGESGYSSFFISGKIPENISLHPNTTPIDIGIRIHHLRDIRPLIFSAIAWFAKLVAIQVKMAYVIIRLRREIGIVTNYFGSYYQLPILVAKLLGKKYIYHVAGSDVEPARNIYGGFGKFVIILLTQWNYFFADLITVGSMKYLKNDPLSIWKKKIRQWAQFFGNAGLFQQIVPISQRDNTVGFLGRMTNDKSVLELVQGIIIFLEKHPDYHFLLIGVGELAEQVDKIISESRWSSRITRLDWVKYEEVQDYLNKMKLMALPSKNEGVPNVIMEAFSCGTPVISTDVGGITDMIIEGETGFLFKGITPEEIAEGLESATEEGVDLEKISQNARAILVEKYSLETSVTKYKQIIDELGTY